MQNIFCNIPSIEASMIRVGLVSYDAGNIGSVTGILEQLVDIKVSLISNVFDLDAVDVVLIPGAGHFGAVAAGLGNAGLISGLKAYANSGKLLIGICAGAQILLGSSDEAPNIMGLNLIPGHTRSIYLNQKFNDRVPRIGWQYVHWSEQISSILGIKNNTGCYYFAHSYEIIPVSDSHIIGHSVDGIVAAIKKDNVWGLQFHPEKSQIDGIHIINNIIKNYA
jgi:glutamine amidotransferase